MKIKQAEFWLNRLLFSLRYEIQRDEKLLKQLVQKRNTNCDNDSQNHPRLYLLMGFSSHVPVCGLKLETGSVVCLFVWVTQTGSNWTS